MSGGRRKSAVGARLVRFALATALVIMLVPSMVLAYGPDSNWEQVGPGSSGSSGGDVIVNNAPPADAPGPRQPGANEFVACGELARPAKPPYTTIVARLDGIWGTHFHIYQSVASSGPYAHKGGCIFYNRHFMSFLISKWMDISNPEEVKPMLYAIFAHECGHLYHHDFSPSRQSVPIEERELEADHFAGYTLYLLHIKFDADQLAHYYQLVGDNFVDAKNSHGSGNERVRAFENGYNRARLGLPESGGAPAAGFFNKEQTGIQ